MTRLHWFIRFFFVIIRFRFRRFLRALRAGSDYPAKCKRPKGKSQEETPSGLSANSGYHSETGGEIHAA
jgi:hypothetical protein